MTVAAKDASLEVTVAFTAHGTHNIAKYQYQVKTTGSFGAWTDSTENVSNTGGTFTIGSLANGTAHTVKVRGVSAAGAARSRTRRPPRPMRRRQSARSRSPRTRRTDKTYIIGDGHRRDRDVRQGDHLWAGTGNPYIELGIGTGRGCDEPSWHALDGPTRTLVCTEPCRCRDEDTDGISTARTSHPRTKQVVGPLGQVANLSFSALAPTPTTRSTASARRCRARPPTRPDEDHPDLQRGHRHGRQHQDHGEEGRHGPDHERRDRLDQQDATKVEITLMTALLSTDTNITVDLARTRSRTCRATATRSARDGRQPRGQHRADVCERGDQRH